MNKKDLAELISLVTSLQSEKDLQDFLQDLLTEKELGNIVERWQIFKGLAAGKSQRQVQKEVGAGIMTVTRGAAWMKHSSKVLKRLLHPYTASH
jgi:Trp operon repressor